MNFKVGAWRPSAKTELRVQEPEKSNPFLDYKSFIDETSDERGDTRTDRLLSLFKEARSNLDVEWHRQEGLRAFIAEYADYNPYIPPVIRRQQILSEKARFDFKPFLEDWATMGGEVVPLKLSGAKFADAINISAEIADRFAKNNLHNDSYFFTKFLEWFVSLEYMETTGAHTVMDIGAAYNGFGKLAHRVFPETHLTLLDLGFPPGRKQLAEGLDQFGANAGDLTGIEDDSLDLAVSHNAFEHFSGDADSSCLKEMARVLKPGGKLLITPFMSARTHFVTVNPFACFVAESTDSLARDVINEVNELKCHVRFNHKIISPFARVYSAQTAFQRLVGADSRLKAVIRPVEFSPEGFEEDGNWPQPIVGKTLHRDVMKPVHFQVLELTKAA